MHKYLNMFKKFPIGTVFGYIPVLILFPIILILIAVGEIEYYYFAYTFVGWVLICGLGIAAGYHRIFAHKTHDLPRWKENLILFFGALGGQGSSIMWSALHRGYHHAHTDTPKDLHSPVNGLFQSFMGYTLKMTEESNIPNYKYSIDLIKKPNHLWFHKNILKIQWGVPLLLCCIDWKLSMMLIILPMCISLIGDNIVNIVGHKKLWLGYRISDTDDNSYNNPLLSILCWGQAWHNGHHSKPNLFTHGKKTSGNWWEFDLCVIFLPFLGKPKYD